MHRRAHPGSGRRGRKRGTGLVLGLVNSPCWNPTPGLTVDAGDPRREQASGCDHLRASAARPIPGHGATPSRTVVPRRALLPWGGARLPHPRRPRSGKWMRAPLDATSEKRRREHGRDTLEPVRCGSITVTLRRVWPQAISNISGRVRELTGPTVHSNVVATSNRHDRTIDPPGRRVKSVPTIGE
jgi:hypothetical protein